jgi:hypothetical protein
MMTRFLDNIGYIFSKNSGGAPLDASPLLPDEGQNYYFLAFKPYPSLFEYQVRFVFQK